MAGIMEELDKMVSFDDVTVLNNPVIESEIFMNALHDACESEQEFAEILESAGTEMSLYDLLPNAEIATEVVKRIQVTDWKAANFNRICRRTAIRMAMNNNDALYTKYRKYRDLLIDIRDKIWKKYGNKARTETRKILKNARNKAANMNSNAGKTIVEKMDQQIAAVEKK